MNLSKIPGLNRKQNNSNKNVQLKLTSHSVFFPFRCSSTVKYTKLSTISEMLLTFLREELQEKIFSLLEYLRSNFQTEALQATSAYKRREFWCETHTSLASYQTHHFSQRKK